MQKLTFCQIPRARRREVRREARILKLDLQFAITEDCGSLHRGQTEMEFYN